MVSPRPLLFYQPNKERERLLFLWTSNIAKIKQRYLLKIWEKEWENDNRRSGMNKRKYKSESRLQFICPGVWPPVRSNSGVVLWAKVWHYTMGDRYLPIKSNRIVRQLTLARNPWWLSLIRRIYIYSPKRSEHYLFLPSPRYEVVLYVTSGF
jgi:hypothetical protein